MADEPIMHSSHHADARGQRGFLARLSRNVAGNTLAMMAIWLIPLCALTGSAIDTARMYVVKVRLQQACDAGVLAGRKFMNDSGSNLDANASGQAQNFFKNNMPAKWLGTSNVVFTPTKTADNQVSGTAKATVPMTLMKMFKVADTTLNVTCEARFDIADADIMFVLDTTGSMACAASGGCSTSYFPYTRSDGTTGYAATEVTNSKIAALRQSVLNFYDTMVENADPTTHIRYGFVPYSTTVNVGKVIPTAWMVGEHTYPSRKLAGESKSGGTSSVTLAGYTSTTCATANARYPGPDPLVREGWTTAGTAYYITGAAWTSGACKGTKQNMIPQWKYADIKYDVTDFKNGTDVVDPTKLTGEYVAKWSGCIEERDTSALTTFDINDLPGDLDPDLPATDYSTSWRPAWPSIVYDRNGAAEVTTTSNYTNVGTAANLKGGLAPCGKEARRLHEMSRSEVEAYVSASGDFRPYGNTYHDSGMIWGTRLLAPHGPFADDTDAWPGRNEPNRHIIFMTDGDMVTSPDVYTLYGLEQSSQRVTAGNLSDQTNRHNARFVAECQAARARNITVWVVAFGNALNAQLKACATQDGKHTFYAKDDAALDAAFKTIAAQIAMLRVSK